MPAAKPKPTPADSPQPAMRRRHPGRAAAANAGPPSVLAADELRAIVRFCEALMLVEGLSANTLGAYRPGSPAPLLRYRPHYDSAALRNEVLSAGAASVAIP